MAILLKLDTRLQFDTIYCFKTDTGMDLEALSVCIKVLDELVIEDDGQNRSPINRTSIYHLQLL